MRPPCVVCTHLVSALGRDPSSLTGAGGPRAPHHSAGRRLGSSAPRAWRAEGSVPTGSGRAEQGRPEAQPFLPGSWGSRQAWQGVSTCRSPGASLDHPRRQPGPPPAPAWTTVSFPAGLLRLRASQLPHRCGSGSVLRVGPGGGPPGPAPRSGLSWVKFYSDLSAQESLLTQQP